MLTKATARLEPAGIVLIGAAGGPARGALKKESSPACMMLTEHGGWRYWKRCRKTLAGAVGPGMGASHRTEQGLGPHCRGVSTTTPGVLRNGTCEGNVCKFCDSLTVPVELPIKQK